MRVEYVLTALGELILDFQGEVVQQYIYLPVINVRIHLAQFALPLLQRAGDSLVENFPRLNRKLATHCIQFPQGDIGNFRRAPVHFS